MLWHFAAHYAKRGNVGRHPDAAIARAIGWDQDPEVLIEALVESGWLDRCPCHRLRVHDWPEHADQGVERSEDVKGKGFIECYAKPLEVSSAPLDKDRQPLPLPSLAKHEPEPKPEPTPQPPGGAMAAVFDHWREAMGHPQAKLDPKREKAIKAALKLGYPAEQLKRAIDGYRASPWHRGGNDRKATYDGLGLILRDAEHIDRGLALAAEHSGRGVPPAAMEPGWDRAARMARESAGRA